MPKRTQIVCLCEGVRGAGIDLVFINTLINALAPAWVRPVGGSSTVQIVPCGSRTTVIDRMPEQLRACLAAGGDTTLMVWADLDQDMTDGEALKAAFWQRAKTSGITQAEFDRVVFAFAKDRLENWVEFLSTGKTDEDAEGPRVKYPKEAAAAARKLADRCRAGVPGGLPPSLEWSCRNWRELVKRMS